MTNVVTSVSQLLALTISAYNSGRFGHAEQLCHRIVVISPGLFDALHLLALAESRPDKGELALANYDRALSVRPDHPEALANRGGILHILKRFDEALASYDCALAVRPDYGDALYNRGVTLNELKRPQEALASYDHALAVQPGNVMALYNRGSILHELGRFEDALGSYDRALIMRPDYAEALSNRANTLNDLERSERALESCNRALAIRPDYIEALCNRCNALLDLKRFEEASDSLDCALTVQPDHVDVLSNRGAALNALNRFDEALVSYCRALAVRATEANVFSNRGVTLTQLKRFEEALASYSRAIAIRGEFPQALCNEAYCRLLTGDFVRGWEMQESRWLSSQKKEWRNLAKPLWLGSTEICGKTILLHAEQGFGDAIQFCRYAPLVSDRGARVILEVHETLRELMGSLAGIAQVVARDTALPAFDLHCPLLSLPLAFATRIETIPASVPYLHASPHTAAGWVARLGPRHRPRIGLTWSGNAKHKNDHNRSIRLGALLSLLDIDATFVSLQPTVGAADAAALKERRDILHFGGDLKNLAVTAALISNLDLVISVDTAVAHLAGALGKPVWVLLPFIPDWRWLLDRDESPWYPTARLFRQDETRRWDGVIARVQAALHRFVQCQTAPASPRDPSNATTLSASAT